MESKEEAKYVDEATGKRTCSDCNMFRAGKCTLVRGKISPDGYCKHWKRSK